MEFRHEPLDRDVDQIRLLRVAPVPRSRWLPLKSKSNRVDESAMIDCTLMHVDLHRLPHLKFKALSYTWGCSTPARAIQLNGKQLTISKNLWQFLYVAAQTPKICHDSLWIDQICIDQSSITERNRQVGLMGQIYQQASGVLIWLGPAGQDSDLALKMIARGEVLAKAGVRKNWYDDSRGYPRISGESFWQPVLNLIQRRYFTRLWIVQEVLQAKSLNVLCGRIMLPWDIFSQTIDKIYDGAAGRGFRLVEGIAPTDPVKALREERDSVRKDYGGRNVGIHVSNSRLSQLICSFRRSESTDQRDRVFGLLGLVGPDEQVEIDYRISLLRLYVNVIMKLTPPAVRSYEHIFFPEDSYPGSFAKTLYSALIDPSYEVDRSKSSHVVDGCKTLCDIIEGEVCVREYLKWRDEPGWIEPSDGENYTFFGENFDAHDVNPEYTCDTVIHLLQYVFSWLPCRDEIVAWWAKDEGWDKNQNIGQLVMKRSAMVRGAWRFVDTDKGTYITYRPGKIPGTLDTVEASPPKWFQSAGEERPSRRYYS